MATIVSHYYNAVFELEMEEAEVLLDIYLSVAKNKRFTPDVTSPERLLIDTHALDTVLYHAENFGEKHRDFHLVTFLLS